MKAKKQSKDFFLNFIKLSKGEHSLKEIVKMADQANITYDSIIDALPKPKITMNDLESWN